MFFIKRKPDPVQSCTSVIEPPVIGPVAELCADIADHPEDYELGCAVKVRHRRDDNLFIWVNGPMFTYSCFRQEPTGPERLLIAETFGNFGRYWQQELARKIIARLSKLKEEREPSREAYDQAFRDLVAASSYHQDGTPIPDDCLRRIAKLAERMLPVLNGTHQIVPVGPVTIETHTPGDPRPAFRDFLTDKPVQEWRDKNGVPHRTRALMRRADKQIEATRRDQKVYAS
jgi:hypothetical protein